MSNVRQLNVNIKCSYSKRKDTLPKDVPFAEALSHTCFNNTINRFLDKEKSKMKKIRRREPTSLITQELTSLTGNTFDAEFDHNVNKNRFAKLLH